MAEEILYVNFSKLIAEMQQSQHQKCIRVLSKQRLDTEL